MCLMFSQSYYKLVKSYILFSKQGYLGLVPFLAFCRVVLRDKNVVVISLSFQVTLLACICIDNILILVSNLFFSLLQLTDEALWTKAFSINYETKTNPTSEASILYIYIYIYIYHQK